MMRHLLLLLALVLTASASYVHDWIKIEAADESELITFHVGLKQYNLDKLEELLYAVSDPHSPQYGRIVPKEEIDDLVNPSQEEHDRVYNFLKEDRPDVEIISYGDAFQVTAPVRDVSAIFRGTFYWYRHRITGHAAIRADINGGIVIPPAIANDVQLVTGLSSFPIITKKAKSSPIESSFTPMDTAYGYFAPATVRRLYSIPKDYQATNANSSQAAMEFYPEGAFSFSDFADFCKLSDEKFFNYTKIVGQFSEGFDNTESELDVQYLATIGSGAQNWFWTVTDGWIWEMAMAIYNNETRPWVFSISYGWPEIMTCNSAAVAANCSGGDAATYIGRANAEMAKLGTMRISIITCSQDEGAPSEANMACQNNTHPVFGMYPGSSPYTLTVSATSAIPDNTPPVPGAEYPPICYAYPCSNSTTEVSTMPNNTAFGWTTGGGFSEITTAPSYQTDAIKKYLSSGAFMPPTQYFWPKNRGYPDVSAVGARVLIVVDGEVSVVEGTSASTPIVAGIITLLNDYRFNNGKTPLGWLNPIIYDLGASNPNAFQDITVGSNQCTEGMCCEYGYGTTTGWDAVTGWGTPNFAAWLDYVKTLP